jgi:pimeloyl-ACP methyl ester carboxylesterase
MKSTRQFTFAVRRCLPPAAALAFALTAVTPALAADDAQGPLVLKAQGSFFVGGEVVLSDALIGVQSIPGITFPTSGTIMVDQMYVRYMMPKGGDGHVPVVMVHGGTLSGKSWETTPDGRMGWDEYFVRKGHPVYVPDQVSRARSGFNQTRFNEVLQGVAPPSALPNIIRLSREFAWTAFRFGPTFGVPYPDTQFPVEAADEFAKQGIPDLNASLPTPNPTVTNMAALARKLEGAILMGHSESSLFPTQAALIDPTGVRGIIGLELGCLAPLTADQLAILKKIPILIMVGDRFTPPLPPPSCVQEMAEINRAGGDMTFISLPDIGMHGNSHMFMLDKNNLQIADVILAWIDKHVEGEVRD